MQGVNEEERCGQVGPDFSTSVVYGRDMYPVSVLPDSRRDSDFAMNELASNRNANQQDKLSSAKRRKLNPDRDSGSRSSFVDEAEHSGSSGSSDELDYESDYESDDEPEDGGDDMGEKKKKSGERGS